MSAVNDARKALDAWDEMHDGTTECQGDCSDFGPRLAAALRALTPWVIVCENDHTFESIDESAACPMCPEPPTDDERETAWRQYLSEHGYATYPTQPDTGADFSAGFDAGFAVGFRRQGPITDAQVKAALFAYHYMSPMPRFEWRDEAVAGMRTALEAARGAS